MRQRQAKSVVREYVEAFVFAIVLALVMRQFVVQAFKIPSESMKTTLLVGDHILVNKFLYYFTSPRRFDIIVFQYPWDEERDFIKRVIGLPGDRVLVRDRQVLVNDQPIQEPYARYASNARHEAFGPIVVPRKGDMVEIRPDKQLYLNGAVVPIPTSPHGGLFQPKNEGPPMHGLEVFYGSLLPPGSSLQQPLAPRMVEADYYFVLGDNRDNSQDSRYWGFVRTSRLRGKAFFIYWSWDRDADLLRHVRLDRLGKLLYLPAL
ncbi:MAG: signal peptidase I [Candidatus Tectimicrobiota bacterium]